MKKKRTKKPTRTDLKKEADRIFSIFIRLRDRDDMGLTCCYTCPVKKDMKRMTNGHFVSRNHLNTRFDELNNHAQCWGCNKWGKGKPTEYAVHLSQDFGEKIVMSLINKGMIVVHDFDYQSIIDIYTEKLNQLGMSYLI